MDRDGEREKKKGEGEAKEEEEQTGSAGAKDAGRGKGLVCSPPDTPSLSLLAPAELTRAPLPVTKATPCQPSLVLSSLLSSLTPFSTHTHTHTSNSSNH